MRELVKDAEDEEGDRLSDCQTAVVRFGMDCFEKVTIVLFVLIAIMAFGCCSRRTKN